MLNNIYYRVNLKYPSSATSTQFYKDFNYGVFFSQQSNTNLFINPHSQDKTLRTHDIITIFQTVITTHFQIFGLRCVKLYI